MNCKRCGAELDEHDQFCYNCGFDVSMDQVIGGDIANSFSDNGEKPIQARFSSTSPDKFDSSLKSATPPKGEDQIDHALKNESSNSFSDSKSNTTGSRMHEIPKKSNKASTFIFTVLLILFLGAVAAGSWFSGGDDSANILPAFANQTSSSPTDYTNQSDQPNSTQVIVQNTTTSNNNNHHQHINKNSTCAYCGGIGKITCPSCGGSGFLTCTACGGDGLLENGETCEACGGQGRVVCLRCQATGHIICPHCGGTGHY